VYALATSRSRGYGVAEKSKTDSKGLLMKLLRRIERRIKVLLIKWIFKDIDNIKIMVGKGNPHTIVLTPSYIDFALLDVAPAAVEGRMYYHTVDKMARFHDGTAWRDIW